MISDVLSDAAGELRDYLDSPDWAGHYGEYYEGRVRELIARMDGIRVELDGESMPDRPFGVVAFGDVIGRHLSAHGAEYLAELTGGEVVRMVTRDQLLWTKAHELVVAAEGSADHAARARLAAEGAS